MRLTCDDPFIRAVVAAPDDDLPRLLWADFLEETAHLAAGRAERAEFVRLQIEIEKFRAPNTGTFACEGKGPPFDCGQYARFRKRCRCGPCSIRRREYECSKRFVAVDWNVIVPTRYDPGTGRLVRGVYVSSVDYRRGFVSELSLPAGNWIAYADAILTACPVARVNRGTADRPDWKGDGLVRLTDDPGRFIETRPTDWHPTSAVSVTVADGDGREIATFAVSRAELARRGGALPSNRELTERALAERWPAVRFELPAVGLSAASLEGVINLPPDEFRRQLDSANRQIMDAVRAAIGAVRAATNPTAASFPPPTP